MQISHIDIYKFSIPMHPFTIATGTMHYAQNILIRVHTDGELHGVGECSAFPMIAGETQNTCFEMAKDFAAIWKGKPAEDIENRMAELHAFTAYNSTIKSAFDMALYDLAAKNAGMPLYRYLKGAPKKMLTDITVGIGTPELMAEQAWAFVQSGAAVLKIKLGKLPADDIERVKQIRTAVGPDILIRTDANQGWDEAGALEALSGLAPYGIEFCEQPMRRYNDHLLPALRAASPVKIMADESAFDHHDTRRLIEAGACDYVNIKFAKSGGILEAQKIVGVCRKYNIPCMMGGMLESRVALSAFAHFAAANDQIVFYDMDTCMLGHKIDPVVGGVSYEQYHVILPDGNGIGADADDDFLKTCEFIRM
jgi:L-Ala-D/L-Glu epimerase